MSKRIIALLLTLVMLVSCLPMGAVAEPVEKAHIHCVCGKQNTLGEVCDSCGKTAVEWTAADALPSAEGHYYLTQSVFAEGVAFSGQIQVAICLHGQTVTSTNGNQILSTANGATVTITDCADEQGKFTGASTYTLGSAIRVKKGSTFIMYGGKITGNTAPSNGDGTVYVDKGDSMTSGGAFYMYGGEISGNTARRGAGIFSASCKSPDLPGSIHIFGGKITNNTGTGTGGLKGGAGILAFCPVEIGGNAQIYGNIVQDGPADIYLRNTSGYQGALIVSSATPLSGDASVNFGADSGDLSGLSGTPSDWSCSWLTYEGQTVSYTGSEFVLGHYHGTQEYAPISDNVGLLNAEGYGYLTKNLDLGGPQNRSKDLHLCLNGHTIKAKEKRRIFNSSSNTPMTLHIEDCSAYTDEAGVYHAGKLTGGDNTEADGTSGVMTIAAKNVVYLHDGIITDNTGNTCGAFVVNGEFYMLGGEISNNSAKNAEVWGNGGALQVGKGGKLVISGGTITGNEAAKGSAIYANSQSVIEITGGKITGNTAYDAAAIYVGNNVALSISGNPVIYNNKLDDAQSNVYLTGNNLLTVGAMVSGAKVGVSAEVGGRAISDACDDYSAYFTSDNAEYKVTYQADCLFLDVPITHIHCLCGSASCTDHASAGFSPWKSGNSLPSSGTFHLTQNVELTSAVAVTDDLTLCLHGYTITQTANKRIFELEADAKLTITDCAASYADDTYVGGQVVGGVSDTGAAIFVREGAIFNLYGGRITGSKPASDPDKTTAGAAIFLRSTNGAGATFNMYGGEITGNGNDKTWGGALSNGSGNADNAVYINIYGGKIFGNTAGTGAAIRLENQGVLTISGGEITGNTATTSGGAIYLSKGAQLDLQGGKITGNMAPVAGGIYAVSNAGDLKISGNPVVTDNTDADSLSNLYLGGSLNITVGQMTEGAQIGITAAKSNRIISNPCDDYSRYFVGDTEDEKVLYQDGALFLGVPITHTHCLCGVTSCADHENAGFAAWKSATTLPTSGSFYLTQNVELTSAVAVSGELKLCLNGYTITQTAQKRVFELEENATLTITDCAVSYADDVYTGGQVVGGVSDTGAAIFVREGAVFNLYGGRITGSKPASAADKATAGAAIFLRSTNGSGATFNMYGGEITGNGNEKSWGGAVSNGSGSADNAVYINIYGGKIFGNTAGTGAAIRLENQGILMISGGEITGNTATSNGGAIYLNKGAQLDLQGGKISGNTAALGGGIMATNTAGEIKVSGAPIVTDNTVSGKQNNLYLSGDLIITLGEMADGANVGVTSAKSDRFISTQTEADYSKYFVSDSVYKVISYKDKALYISASGDHNHCVCDSTISGCDHNKHIWTAWESTSTLPTASGYYYLVADVQLTAIAKMEKDQKIFLCLNGKTVKAAETTGHMILANGTELSITDCNDIPGGFTGGNKAYGGSVNVVAGSIMNLYAGEFYGNTAPSSEGGAIYLQGGNNNNGALPGGIFNMYGGKIHDNTAGIGGGIRAAGLSSDGGDIPSVLNIYGGEIYNNKTFYKLSADGKPSDIQGEGGAIAATNGTTVNIYGGTISKNVAEDDGGAIYANGKAKINIKGGKILENESKKYGGAIFITAADTEVVMDGGELRGNKASSGGAVMMQSNTKFTMNGGSISGNAASSSGGGLYVSTKTEFEMNGGEISANTATGSGAGFYALRSKVTLNGGAISSNKADYRGGAFVASGATIDINKVTIENNSAKEGGAAYINRSKSTTSAGVTTYTPSVATINEGALITGNVAETNCGGMIVANDDVVMTMNGGTFTKNTAMNGGAVMTWTGATFVMKGGSINDNTASVHGGGLYISTKSTLKMEGGSVSNNTARNGGGIYMLRSAGEFTGGDVSYNYTKQKVTWKDGEEVRSGGSAGAMYMSGADCNIWGTNFIGNTSEGNGGAIVLGRNTYTENGVKKYDDTSLNIHGGIFSGNHSNKAAGALLIQSKETVVNMYGGTFANNTSATAAGAIYASSDTTFNMYGGSIVDNRSETTGGGIYVLRSKVTITGGELNCNTAAKSGGQLVVSGAEAEVLIKNIKLHSGQAKLGSCVVVQSQGNFTAENCEFYDNMAETGAPAVYISTRTAGTLIGCKFYNNQSKGTAGAVSTANFAELNITDCEFTNNKAGTMGGAVYANPASLITIKNSTFKNCTAGERGGAITCRGSMFLIDSVIENCSAKAEGGAVYTDTNTAGGSGAQRGFVVEGSEIRNNTAGGMGGAFYVYRGCRLEIYDSKITGNSTPAEGGAIWAYEDLELHNTQITDNSSGGVGYAVYMNDSNYDGHSYFANHNKLSGSTIIKDNQGGDLWMGSDVVFAIVGQGLGENAHIQLVLDSGVVTSRILGAYDYEGGNQVYTITYGDRSMTDPEMLPVEDETPTEDVQTPVVDPEAPEDSDKNLAKIIIPALSAGVVLIAAAVVILAVIKKKKLAKDDGK